MSKVQQNERKEILRLIAALKERTVVTDPKSEFKNKVSYETAKLSDFYHEDYHNDERKDNSKYHLDQVRVKSIGGTAYTRRYASIRSVGIMEEVVSLKNFSSHDNRLADTVDGNSRIIVGEAVEFDTQETLEVPHFIIEDQELVELVRRKKKFFQNKMNDVLPNDVSDKEDVLEYIRQEVSLASAPDQKHFKEELIDEVHEMTKLARARSTIKGWVTEGYKERKQNNSGITCWKPRDKRYAAVRKALEASNIPDIAGKWNNDDDLDHQKYRIYSKSTNKGNLEKDLGTQVVAAAHKSDPRPAICIFYTEASTVKKVAEAQIEAFSKLASVQGVYSFYKYSYALGQIKGQDSGDLVTCEAAQTALQKINQPCIVSIAAAK